MSLPFWLVFLPQFLYVLAQQTFSVHRNTHYFGDVLKLPSSMCSSNSCGNFYAQRSSNDTECSCVCLSNNATTASWGNGSFGCIEDQKIRERELKGCRQVRFVDEKQTDALRTISLLNNSETTLELISDKHCVVLALGFDYQACGGKWIPLNHSVEWKLQTSQLRANSRVGVQHKFTIKNSRSFQHLRGKIVKFVVVCQAGNQKEEMCTLLKVAGSLTCPWTNPFSITEAPTTTHLLNEPAAKPSSHMTRRMTTTEATRSGQEILHEIPNGIPAILIGVIAGSSVFVLLVVAITTVVICRWRNSRHSHRNDSQPSKRKLSTVQVESTDRESQSKIDEGKMAYQSLLPITKGAVERGLYMSPYNMPELSLEESNSGRVPAGDNTYHLPQGPAIANSSEELPRQADFEGKVLLNPECGLNISNIPEYDYADSHALCKLAIAPNRSGPSEVGHQVPRHKAPESDVPEGPKLNGLHNGCSLEDQEEEFYEQGPYYHKLEDPDSREYSSSKCTIDGDQDILKERAPYYCALEGPDSVEQQDDVFYEKLETEGRLSISYQPLHKYAYVGVRDKQL